MHEPAVVQQREQPPDLGGDARDRRTVERAGLQEVAQRAPLHALHVEAAGLRLDEIERRRGDARLARAQQRARLLLEARGGELGVELRVAVALAEALLDDAGAPAERRLPDALHCRGWRGQCGLMRGGRGL